VTSRFGGDPLWHECDAEPVRNDRVDTVMIKDPDGNSIAFAMPKDSSLAR